MKNYDKKSPTFVNVSRAQKELQGRQPIRSFARFALGPVHLEQKSSLGAFGLGTGKEGSWPAVLLNCSVDRT